MITGIAQLAILIREYDEAMRFYCGTLGFTVEEDAHLSTGKRRLRIKAPGKQGSEILLSRAIDNARRAIIGNQADGRYLPNTNAQRMSFTNYLKTSRRVPGSLVRIWPIRLCKPYFKNVDREAFDRTLKDLPQAAAEFWKIQ